MKCPHCLQGFHSQAKHTLVPHQDQHFRWSMFSENCPECGNIIIVLQSTSHFQEPDRPARKDRLLVYPRAISRSPLSKDVPDEFATDYQEACLVLPDSPKASAALSRRCLQHLLREVAKTRKKDLADQIDEVLPHLPSYLADQIDGVRNIGNFAAHPIKSTNTGEIIDVEPGEAEWLLDTLEMAFDFYLVQPAERQRKRDAINQKLAEAGKPQMR